MTQSTPPGSTLKPLWMRFFIATAILTVMTGLGILEYVRGQWVGTLPEEQLTGELTALAQGPTTIGSEAELVRLAAVAARLCVQGGLTPGEFRVAHRDRLDVLEKARHLIHGPFTGIRRMYCDVWINSLTTYGQEEPTWGFTTVHVRPALRLPILLFLMDRLGRGRTTLQEHLGAVPEAIRGMEMHTLSGRARLWLRLLDHGARAPQLARFITRQLEATDRDWTDDTEVRFWDEVTARPALSTVVALAGGPPDPREVAAGRDPHEWSRAASLILGEMVAALKAKNP